MDLNWATARQAVEPVAEGTAETTSSLPIWSMNFCNFVIDFLPITFLLITDVMNGNAICIY